MICTLCPRNCAAKREAASGNGYCGMGTEAVIARAAPHMWEEPCISGVRGSGTIFFSGCSLGCAYCQNHVISHEKVGKRVDAQTLAAYIAKLEDAGVHNISFVTGTHFVPEILRALRLHRPSIPIVWNCGGYESLETLKMLEGWIDIYLPDLKHMSPRLGKLLCNAPDYFDIASRAILEMLRQTNDVLLDENGVMQRGTVIRHLVLPGCTGDSLRLLDWISENTPDGTPVSIMRQYTPIPQCTIKGMDRRVTDDEYARVVERAISLSLNAMIQEKEAAQECFIPDFDLK